MDKMTIHAAAVAKIHAMRKDLLHEEDYQELLEQEQPMAWIKNRMNLDSQIQNVQELESELQKRSQVAISKIYHFYHLAYRKFFQAILMRFEIEWIKGALRRIENHDRSVFAERTILPTLFSHFDPQKLVDAKTLAELKDAISYKPYLRILSQLDGLEDSRIFHIEMSLDKLYFKAVSDAMKRLGTIDQKIVEDVAGFNIDLLNLHWMLRAKQIYKISPEEIFNYTLYKGKKYTMNDLQRMAYLSVQELTNKIQQGPYAEVFLGSEINRELDIEVAIYQKTKPLETRFPNSIATLLCFLHDLEYQMQDIAMIIEAKSYDIDVGPLLIGRRMQDGRRKN